MNTQQAAFHPEEVSLLLAQCYVAESNQEEARAIFISAYQTSSSAEDVTQTAITAAQ